MSESATVETKRDGATAPVSRQVVQGASKTPEAAGEKVSVYCALPHGLRLRVFAMTSRSEPVLGGGFRDFKEATPIGEEVLVQGNRFRVGEQMTHRVVGNYGVTVGVDKDFWERWLADNKDTPVVKNGLIFASAKRDYGDDEADDRSKSGIRSGFEPMEKDGDPRAPKPQANLSGIKANEAD